MFLPAGGVSSLAFFSGPIVKKGIKETQIVFASSMYAFVGIVTVVFIAIPVFIYAFVVPLVVYATVSCLFFYH